MRPNLTAVDIAAEIERPCGTKVPRGENKEGYRGMLKALSQSFPPHELGRMILQLVARGAWTELHRRKPGNEAVPYRAAVRLQKTEENIQFIDDILNGRSGVTALRQFRVLSHLCDTAVGIAALHLAADEEIEEYPLSPADAHEGTALSPLEGSSDRG
jgi:hypothetical protein